MALFSGSNKPGKSNVPVSQVMGMRDQGLSNNQIIQSLQRDGFSSSQIFEAMNQADMNPAVSGASSGQISQEQNNSSNPNFNSTPASTSPMEPSSSQMNFSAPHAGHSPLPPMTDKQAEIEELVESIIEEKWEEIAKDINRIIGWKNKVESKLSTIEQDFNSLKEEFDKLHNAVIGKIGEYDKNILNVGAEVKAMEKVFSKVLPVFTENVSELSRISDNFKSISKK